MIIEICILLLRRRLKDIIKFLVELFMFREIFFFVKFIRKKIFIRLLKLKELVECLI